MRRFALFALALATSTTIASAADIAAPPAFDWTGFYLGVNAGAGFGNSDWSDIEVPSDTDQNLSGDFSSSDFNGFVGGFQAGYNYQTGMVVLGVEGNMDFGSLSGSDTCFGNPDYGDYSADCETDVNWMGDITLRLGITPMDRMMLYVKGGASYANAEFHPNNETGPYDDTGGYDSADEDLWGYVIGGGVEYAVTDNVTIGAEYNYRNFGEDRTHFSPGGIENEYNPPFSANTSLEVSTVVARLNYKF